MVTIFILAKEKIFNWPKSGPVETGPTGTVATPLSYVDKPTPLLLQLQLLIYATSLQNFNAVVNSSSFTTNKY